MLQDEPFEIYNRLNAELESEVARDILHGMSKRQKSIPSKYFYDSYGSKLFEMICDTPEYYPTRSEISILHRSAHRIMSFFSKGTGDLIELGSGSTRKIRILIDGVSPTLLNRLRYIPVDISDSALEESVKELSITHEKLHAFGIAADFTNHLDMLPTGRKLIAFLGGTIGNFTEEESIRFLSNIAKVMSPGDRLLLGMDMLKPVEILEAAYNDRQGLTREFNLNILTNINRKLHADFRLEDFEHLAFFNKEEEQIEMHLRARRSTAAFIADLTLPVSIGEGETIRTEISRKFSRESAARILQKAGLSIYEWFTDPREWFSLLMARVFS
jgi:L-histidine N-alpha-methyltransferase